MDNKCIMWVKHEQYIRKLKCAKKKPQRASLV